jgi:alpha-glucosidase (family GH31 glycosyl hydrolase)
MKLRPLLILLTAAAIAACSGRKFPDSPARDQSIHPHGKEASWKSVASGVWRSDLGTPETANLLDAAGSSPRFASLEVLPQSPFPLNPTDIRYEIRDGKTYLRIPLDSSEQIYGFGLNFQTVHRRGQILRLHVDHYGSEDNGRTHAPVPFYVSSRGYGLLINTARYLDVWIGTAVRKDSPHPPPARDRTTDPLWSAQPASDGIEVLVPAAGASIYLFGGPSLLNVVQRYNLYCGGGVLPPKWGLGFWQRVPTAFSEPDVRKEAEDFASHGFPLDVIGLEPGWQSRAYPCSYEWDPNRFPRPGQFAREMLAGGVRLNLWINPYVSPDASLSGPLSPYTGSHTVWCGTVPDYSLREAREILTKHFMTQHLDLGVSGYKIDECDGYDSWLWPDVATFPSGLTGEQMRQTYPLFLQKMAFDMFRKKGSRTYGLVRGSNAGANALPFVLYSDYYSHAGFVTALVNSGFAGVLWVPEVRSSKTGEEWLRRIQSSCFSPMATINAWADGTKPWSFPEVFPAVKQAALLRNSLLPYLYTAFARYYRDGIPPFRSPVLEPGFLPETGDTSAYARAAREEIKDEYMMGDCLLVAPMFAGQQERKVLLPRGRWFDFYTGKFAGDGQVVTVAPGLDRIPLFVKDGGLIPMVAAQRQVSLLPRGLPLEVRHYGLLEGVSQVYDDDGVSFAYEKGEFLWRAIRARRLPDGSIAGSSPEAPQSASWGYGRISWRGMTK